MSAQFDEALPEPTPASQLNVHSVAVIKPDPRIDAAGRDIRVWPTSPHFDFQHVRLEITIPNMAKPAFRGIATHTLAAVGVARAELVLDAGDGLDIRQVQVNSKRAEFSHDKKTNKLRITQVGGRRFAVGERADVRIEYVAIRPGNEGSGLNFSGDDARTPEIDYQCHAQGQPQSNHRWFPCHDFPNERSSSELIVTVPGPYEAVSNGRLVSVIQRPMTSPIEEIEIPNWTPPAASSDSEDVALDTPGSGSEDSATDVATPAHTITYHWLQELPHPSYLITLVVGRFEVANVGGQDSARPGLWMPVYGPIGAGEANRRTFENTPKMMAHFEQLFGLTYPWDKYAQIICRDYQFGAMENTGAVTFSSNLAPARRAGAIDDIIAHELVHHWFGDLVTCRSWEHLWLNEGWATMSEALWVEKVRGRDAYQAAILRNVGAERAISRDRSAPARTGMVSHRYRDPTSRFMSPDNVYQKGGVVLHMLRARLGDEAFFAGTRQYLREHMYNQTETDDFRIALETASGQSLERFFEQWCVRPGHPELSLDYTWTPASADTPDGPGVLDVDLEQTQTINADNPAYAFELPLYIRFDQPRRSAKAAKDAEAQPKPAPKAANTWLDVGVSARSTRASIALDAKPLRIEIDPDLTVLSRNKVRTALAMGESPYRELAEFGSTFYVRWQAGQELAALEALRQTSLIDAGSVSTSASGGSLSSGVSTQGTSDARFNAFSPP